VGPITIFDKSAFQALSAREHLAVFMHLYPNITPVLVYEVLGDLTKNAAAGKRPADAVATLAKKFGGSGGPVNAPYMELARVDLLGGFVPMTGQIIPDNSFQSSSGGVIIDMSPLNEAILRWSGGHFTESEAEISAYWRRLTHSASIGSLSRHLNDSHVVIPRPDSEARVVASADGLLGVAALQEVWFEWALQNLIAREAERALARQLWRTSGATYVHEYAPFAAHCLRCLLSLTIAVRHRFLADRATHLIDLQYLFYLPFAHVLASDDRVHRLLAPQLVRADQTFVTGQELKAGLRATADDWDRLDEGTRRRRSFALGSYPVPVDPPVLYDLWRKHMRPWEGDRPSGNLIISLTDAEAEQAMEEARELILG
jgi:hypothetical protein